MQIIPLDGTWRIAADPENIGLQEMWYRGAPQDDAVPIAVPGKIEDAFPRYDGVVWYWRTIPSPSPATGRVLLRFHAVEYLTDVWINGHHVGQHEGGNTPFSFDITDQLTPGANRLAVRVLHVGTTPINGLDLAHIPHSLRGTDPTYPNWGGIWQSVELCQVPLIAIADIFSEPHWADGAVTAHVTLANATAQAATGQLTVTVWEDRGGRAMAEGRLEPCAEPGETTQRLRVEIPHAQAWSPDDPFLYRLEARWESADAADRASIRFGLREFTYADGYFRLNGKRFFPRSAHTIGVYPGGMQPVHRDLLRQELLTAKAAGLNMLRILGTCAIPPQLDYADEVGILIYQEHAAAWAIADTPETALRHTRELTAVIRRDRNHPSVVIWGVLNEVMIFVPDGPVVTNAINLLPTLRALDPTRLLVLDSGRYNYARWHVAMFQTRPDIGNFALPYTNVWMDEIADIHTYGEYPTSALYRQTLRQPPVGERKVFQTEFGHNTLIDLEGGLRKFEQAGFAATHEEYAVWHEVAQRFYADWETLRMDEVFATPRHFWDADRQAHAYKIRGTWTLVQANPQQIATNYTAFCDEMMNAEGIVDYFRDAKPALPTLRAMQQPLLWCLFVTPQSVYVGAELTIEALLRNEDVLPPGSYPAELLLFGSTGVVWRKSVEAVIPAPPEGYTETTLVVHPVFAETVRMDFPPGAYEVHVRLLAGGDARMSLPIQLAARAVPPACTTVAVMGFTDAQQAWLTAQGIAIVPFATARTDIPLLVHQLWCHPHGSALLAQALDFADAGGTVLLLECTGTEYPLAERQAAAQQEQQALLHQLPGMDAADLVWDTRNWFTGTAHYVRPHPVFAGLPSRCLMEDQPVYQPVYPMHSVAGAEGWQEISGAFSTGALPFGGTEHEGLPPYFHYWHALDLATRRHGAGLLVYCAYQLLEHLDADPAAGQLLLNLLQTYGVGAQSGA